MTRGMNGPTCRDCGAPVLFVLTGFFDPQTGKQKWSPPLHPAEVGDRIPSFVRRRVTTMWALSGKGQARRARPVSPSDPLLAGESVRLPHTVVCTDLDDGQPSLLEVPGGPGRGG